jgi:hypothetical protein
VRLILRFIAAVMALMFIAIVMQLLPMIMNGELWQLAASGLVGVMTIVGWLLIVFVAPLASLRLYQLKRSGLMLTAMLFALAAAYYIVGLFVRPPGAAADYQAPIGPLLVNTASCVLLLSPAARRACTDE